MLKRKAEKCITKWIKNPQRALMISGARQIGKTFSIRHCLSSLGVDFVELNLIFNPELVGVLEKSFTAHDLSVNLSLATGKKLTPGKTFIFIDEIQQYKDIVTKIKFWVDDGSFKYIMSGSLLGVELNAPRSAPVGYLEELKMYPLDFEEFLWASSVPEAVIEDLKSCFEGRCPVSDYIHEKMMELFRRYLAVGGMPSAVQEYVSSGDMNSVTEIQRNIIELYKKDFTKYELENRKLIIIDIYNSIPSQLLKQNRRFSYTDVKKGLRFEQAESSFLWLTAAGTAISVYNTTEPRVSLSQNKKSSLLKLYCSDVGLLTCMYGDAAKLKILIPDGSLNCGGVFENAVAQELWAHGYDLYFYNSHKIGELDFVIESGGNAVPLEIKSGKDYYIHSAISNVTKNSEYKIPEAVVLGNCNVRRENAITYMPVYFAMFFSEHVQLPVLKVDLEF